MVIGCYDSYIEADMRKHFCQVLKDWWIQCSVLGIMKALQIQVHIYVEGTTVKWWFCSRIALWSQQITFYVLLFKRHIKLYQHGLNLLKPIKRNFLNSDSFTFLVCPWYLKRSWDWLMVKKKAFFLRKKMLHCCK